MAVTHEPIFAQTPVAKPLSLAAVTACTTRAPTPTASLAAANILELTPISVNGIRVDRITVSACSTSITAPTTAGIVGVWLWDGTNAYLMDEIVISVVTPSTTVPAFSVKRDYDLSTFPSTHKLYVSSTVTTTASTNALQVTAFGGLY